LISSQFPFPPACPWAQPEAYARILMHYFSRLPLLLAAGTLSWASAQSINPNPDPDTVEKRVVELEHVVVSAHPYGRSAHEIAQPTSILSGLHLDQEQASTLGELLAGEPGVSSTYFGPGASRPIIRALGGPRVAVLENGTDTLDASIVSPDHAVSLDPLLIERVEITRGPAALLQGSSAIGGAVNVITHRIHQNMPDAPLTGRAETRFGTVDNERSAGLVVEGGTGSIAWHIDAFRRETDDVDIPGFAESAYLRALEAAAELDEMHEEEEEEEEEEEHHEEDKEAFGYIPNTAVKSTGGAAGFSWIGDRGFIGFSTSRFDTRYGIPPGAHAHEEHHEEDEAHAGEEEEEEEALVSIDLNQRRFQLEGELRNPFPGWQAFRFKATHADYDHTEFEGDEIGTVFTNTGYDIRFDALHEEIRGFKGALGLKASSADFTAIGAEAFLPPTNTDTFALFLFEEFEQADTIWQFGGRSEWQDIATADGTDRAVSGNSISSSFGWVHQIGQDWSIAGSVAHAERLPNAQELFAEGPHIGTNAYEIGNANLSSEMSRGLDLTLRRETGFVSGEATVFFNRFEDYIFENATGAEIDELPVYEFVQRDAEFYGAEIQGTFHLHQSERGHVDFTAAADVVRARNVTDDTDLPRTTPARVRLGLDWQREAWRVGTEIQHVLPQKRVATDEVPTTDYTLISAYIGYRWIASHTTWDILLRGTNLANNEARAHTSFLKEVAPLPGRNVSLSLRASF
jgi:iron complex outermembrane receptor protein